MGTGKRPRGEEEEACEALGSLLRQTASRAMERLRLQRVNRIQAAGGTGGGAAMVPPSSGSGSLLRNMQPIDVLVVQFLMYYFRVSDGTSENHFLVLARAVVTSNMERVFAPAVFEQCSSLPSLCESLSAEHTAEEMEEAVRVVNEMVDARAALGEWLEEKAAGDSEDEEVDYGGGVGSGWSGWDPPSAEVEADSEEWDDGEEVAERSGIKTEKKSYHGVSYDVATSLYTAMEFWVRVQAFLHALSLHSASLHSYVLPPRYERELLLLLHNISRGAAKARKSEAAAKAPRDFAAEAERGLDAENTAPAGGAWRTSDTIVPRQSQLDGDSEDSDEAVAMDDSDGSRLDVASAVLADALALSRCRAPVADGKGATCADGGAKLNGVHPEFFKMVHARLGLMVSRSRLYQFGCKTAISPPPLTVQQRNAKEQQEQRMRLGGDARTIVDAAAASDGVGLPVHYVPDDAYYDKLLHAQHDAIDEDEELYKGEVLDYYLTASARQRAMVQAAAADSASSATRSAPQRSRQRGGAPSSSDEAPLVKPHRFCKIKTGYTWTQYNRTHYDSRTNPPPRTEMWYEFTLFYPALAHTKRDMRNIFYIEDPPEGPNDQYCLLVFSVGPPYADVAYRIRKKQWDPRRGGVRISFDQNGRYKLFFRFTNSNYRR